MTETVSQIGCLHMEQDFLDLAKDAYWEALRVYCEVYRLQLYTPMNTKPQHPPPDASAKTLCVLDLATTLTNLGWLHLLDDDLNWLSSR